MKQNQTEALYEDLSSDILYIFVCYINSKISMEYWCSLMLIIHSTEAPLYKKISLSISPDTGYIWLVVENKFLHIIMWYFSQICIVFQSNLCCISVLFVLYIILCCIVFSSTICVVIIFGLCLGHFLCCIFRIWS